MGPDEVTRGGLTVYAALDGKMQKAANEAVQRGLRELDKRQGYRGPVGARRSGRSERAPRDLGQRARASLSARRRRPSSRARSSSVRPIWDLKEVTLDIAKKALSSAPPRR